MLESGSNRVGALDFQSTLNYQGRHQAASLDELHRASEAVAAGERIPQELDAAEIYGLSRTEARERIDRTVDSIIQNFHSAAEQAQLTEHQRSALWGNEILHPGAFDEYQSTMSSRPQDPALAPEYHQSPEQDAPDHGPGLS